MMTRKELEALRDSVQPGERWHAYDAAEHHSIVASGDGMPDHCLAKVTKWAEGDSPFDGQPWHSPETAAMRAQLLASAPSLLETALALMAEREELERAMTTVKVYVGAILGPLRRGEPVESGPAALDNAEDMYELIKATLAKLQGESNG